MIEGVGALEKLPLMSSIATRGSLLDDCLSHRSSLSQRLARKPDPTRKTNRKNSPTTTQLAQFFVKSSEPSQPRPSLLQRNDPTRKRCPTPVPGHHASGRFGPHPESEERQTAHQLALAQLERRCSEERALREVFEKRSAIFEREVKARAREVQQLERELAGKAEAEGKNKLQRLKLAIRQNRQAELQAENARLKKQNEQIRKELQDIEEENEILCEKCRQLDEHIYRLQKTNAQLSKQEEVAALQAEINRLARLTNRDASDREQALEAILAAQKHKEAQLMKQVDSLELQINLLRRRNTEELRTLREKKAQEMSKLRSRVGAISKQYSDLKLEADLLRLRHDSSRKSCLQRDSHQLDDLSFDLSPEHE